ncbi:MAG: ABC transporter ATP-binding protein/permease, partial [Desulfovibrio sp.]|nr:ABC transporter ATP-binding protein/permease [Desulfovibrio sp.]
RFLADFLRVYAVLPPALRRRTLGVFFFIVVLACLEVLSILSISFLALSIAAPEKLADFGIVARVFRQFPALAALCADPRVFALIASASVVLLAAAKNAMSAFVALITARLGEKIALFAGETIFRHFLYSPYIDHISGDSQKIYQAMSWRGQLGALIINIMMVYTYAAIALGLLFTLVSATPETLFLIIVCVGIVSWGIYKSVKKSLDQAGLESVEFSQKEFAATMNAMRGIREVLIYRQQPVFFEKFQQASLGGMPSRAFLGMAPSIPTWILETVGFLVIPITLWILLRFHDASMARITGVLTMIMLACWRILPILNRSLACLVTVRGARATAMECLTRVEHVLANPVADAAVEPDPQFTLKNDICFHRVSFRYPKAEEDCLSDLEFSLVRGQCTGIVGPSGAGKSTMVGLLSGLLKPTEGAVLVDGKDPSPAELAAYALQVGYVPQTPYIMPGTLAENVAFSQWGKPYDEEQVRQACRLAALDIVEAQGILLPIGENGAGLSGGQAQRLSIARALYANPKLLILDEATSALDSATEAAIMNTIYSLSRSITTIIIAHRLTTVQRCDSLLWIDKGKLVESGPCATVLPKYEAYLAGKSVGQTASTR